MATENSVPSSAQAITTLIFDVDDTLYDVSTGFTAHRNTDGAVSFMVDRLKFTSREEAQAVRDEYFARFHATAKGLQVAEAEGRLPPNAPKFDPKELSEYWAENLDFALLGPKDEYAELKSVLETLQKSHQKLNLVAFSNGPRKYVLRVLREIGLNEIFPEQMVFGVDDILPFCKPQPEAFDAIFKRVGEVTGQKVEANNCVMFEDSMKNIRAAKDLGMKTVLIAGKGRLSGVSAATTISAEATKPGDAPDANDPAVDLAVEVAADMQDAIPDLWQNLDMFSAITATATASSRRNPVTVVDLSLPTFPSSYSINANPGSDALLNLASTIPELRALLVLEHGHLVATYSRSDVDTAVPYKVISTTKSWLSLVIGLMIQEGCVRLDETLGEIFDDCNMWLQNCNGGDDKSTRNFNNDHEMEEDLKFRQAITLKDILTMTSGLRFPDTTFDAAGNEQWSNGGETLSEALLEPPRININNDDQAKTFHYLGANNILSYICKQRTEYASPREYLAAKVFPSLGINDDDIDWKQNKEGMEYAFHGLSMTPTQMTKLGQLFLQRGRSNSRHTLIHEDWIMASTSLQGGNADYGYLWWVYPTMFCAKGLGGQDVCVSPLTDRVVVQQRDFNFERGKDEAISATSLAALALNPDLIFSDSPKCT